MKAQWLFAGFFFPCFLPSISVEAAQKTSPSALEVSTLKRNNETSHSKREKLAPHNTEEAKQSRSDANRNSAQPIATAPIEPSVDGKSSANALKSNLNHQNKEAFENKKKDLTHIPRSKQQLPKGNDIANTPRMPLVPQQPKENPPSMTPQHHYALQAPKGWQCINDKKQLPSKVEMVFIGTGKGQFTPSINLATEKTEMTLKEYVDLSKQYHEGQGETTCRSLGTIETNMGSAHMLQIDRQTQWGTVRFLQASLIKNGSAFVITATCLLEDYNALSAQFIRSIQSFTINPVS